MFMDLEKKNETVEETVFLWITLRVMCQKGRNKVWPVYHRTLDFWVFLEEERVFSPRFMLF